MKKLLPIFFAITFILGLTSCRKPKHEIRLKNEYSRAVTIYVGPNYYGSITPGKTTSYQSIPEGDHTLGGDAQGSISVTGKGAHKWTLTVTSSGGFTIKEDK